MAYRTLQADNIEATIQKLLKRIEERFPNRGIVKLCGELLLIAREDRQRLSFVTKPNFLVRAGVAIALGLGIAGVGWTLMSISTLSVNADNAFDAVQGVEAVLNIVALAGAAIWFLLNLESNMRRERVLADLHELRSIAHVVDMHQLTKDPTQFWQGYTATASSEVPDMTSAELIRYLDYCSEMLSLTGKLAALYMQDVRDSVIIEAVTEIEDLTTSLSRKIWQKIMILQQNAPAAVKPA